MTTETPDPEETDVAEWYRQKIMNAEFEDIPQTDAFLEVELPGDAEEIARERFEAAREEGKDVAFADYLNDHVNLHIAYVVSGDVPDGENSVIQREDDE